MYYLISASSNDASIGVLRFSTLDAATEAGDSIGYIPAYRSIDPYMIVAEDSELGIAITAFFKDPFPIDEEIESDSWSEYCIEPGDFDCNPVLKAALIEASNSPNTTGNMAELVAEFGGCEEDYPNNWRISSC